MANNQIHFEDLKMVSQDSDHDSYESLFFPQLITIPRFILVRTTWELSIIFPLLCTGTLLGGVVDIFNTDQKERKTQTFVRETQS